MEAGHCPLTSVAGVSHVGVTTDHLQHVQFAEKRGRARRQFFCHRIALSKALTNIFSGEPPSKGFVACRTNRHRRHQWRAPYVQSETFVRLDWISWSSLIPIWSLSIMKGGKEELSWPSRGTAQQWPDLNHSGRGRGRFFHGAFIGDAIAAAMALS